MKYKINNIIRLSKIVEKEYRIPHSKSKATNKYRYFKPNYAGIYYHENKTCLTNGYWALSFNDIINNDEFILANRTEENENFVDIFWKTNLKEINFNDFKKYNDDYYIINNKFYKIEDIETIINTTHKQKFYICENEEIQILYILCEEAKAIVCPMKEKKNDL